MTRPFVLFVTNGSHNRVRDPNRAWERGGFARAAVTRSDDQYAWTSDR